MVQSHLPELPFEPSSGNHYGLRVWADNRGLGKYCRYFLPYVISISIFPVSETGGSDLQLRLA